MKIEHNSIEKLNENIKRLEEQLRVKSHGPDSTKTLKKLQQAYAEKKKLMDTIFE